METSRPSLAPFDTKDTSSIATRWTKWKRSLDLLLEVNCVGLPTRKKSHLLHYDGSEVQDIFYEIEGHDAPAPPGTDVYREAIRLLDAYFAPMASVPYDRFVFRTMKQTEGETVEIFVSRLRQQGRLCEYGTALDMRITEQVFDHCLREELREAILKKKLMTVTQIIEEARVIETVQRNREQMAKEHVNAEESSINRINMSKKDVNCYRCGRVGHFANDKSCPAKKKMCDRCNIVGHFKKMCKTKQDPSNSKKHSKVRMIADSEHGLQSDDSEVGDDSDVCNIYATNNELQQGIVTCYTGGVKLNWVVDSGAHVNVISRTTYGELKHKGCKYTKVQKPQEALRVYGDGKLKVH